MKLAIFRSHSAYALVSAKKKYVNFIWSFFSCILSLCLAVPWTYCHTSQIRNILLLFLASSTTHMSKLVSSLWFKSVPNFLFNLQPSFNYFASHSDHLHTIFFCKIIFIFCLRSINFIECPLPEISSDFFHVLILFRTSEKNSCWTWKFAFSV